MQHKLLTRTIAAVLSLTLVAGALPPAGFSGLNINSAALTAVAAENPNDPDSVTYKGDFGEVKYYNVRSQSFDDNAALFYQELLGHNENMGNGLSIADSWTRLAMLILHGAGNRTTPSAPWISVVPQSNKTYYNLTFAALLYQENDFTKYVYYDKEKNCTISELQWDKEKKSAYRDIYFSFDPRVIRIEFSDFQVQPMFPDGGVSGNYIATSGYKSFGGDKDSDTTTYRNDGSTKGTIDKGFSTSLSSTLTNSVETSQTYSFTEGIEIGAECSIMDVVKIGGKVNFSATQSFTNGKSTSVGQEDGVTRNDSIHADLPPHTAASIRRENHEETVLMRYKCPVTIGYNVKIQMFDFLSNTMREMYSFGANGLDAREDLYVRAMKEGKTDGYDREDIKWSYVRNNYMYTLNNLTTTAPMCAVDGTMYGTRKTDSYVLEGVYPTKPLAYVTLSAPQNQYLTGQTISYQNFNYMEANMKVGDSSYTNYLTLEGFDDDGVPFDGFTKCHGHWVVVDEQGKEIPADKAPVKIDNQAATGNVNYTAVRPGKCFLKYMIDENYYHTVDSVNVFSKNADLSATAALAINVKEQLGLSVSGSYSGYVNSAEEYLEGLGKLMVSGLDSTGMAIDYVWQTQLKNGLYGITLSPEGKVTFSAPGEYKVRVRSAEKIDGEYLYSEWVTVKAVVNGDDEYIPFEPVEDTDIVDADENTSFVITSSYTGLVGQPADHIEEPFPPERIEKLEAVTDDGETLYKHRRLQVMAYDVNDQQIAVNYVWEAKEDYGIELTEDGMVSFSQPGTYHVRVRSGEFASDWIAVTAGTESEEYSTIEFHDIDGTPIQSVLGKWGSAYEAPVPVKEGYVFAGWSEELPAVMPADSMNVYAQWTEAEPVEKVQIRANTEGNGQIAGTFDGTEPELNDEYPKQSMDMNAVKGDLIILTAKADEGWTFVGWRDNDDPDTLIPLDTISFEAGEERNLTAVFLPEDDPSLVTYQLTVNTEGQGQVTAAFDGSEPQFSDEYPLQSLYYDLKPDAAVSLAAKPAEGWRFKGWKNADTGKMIADTATTEVTLNASMNLTAVFEMLQSDDVLKAWSEKDYYTKTGKTVTADITAKNDAFYEITLTDEAGNVAATYKIDPVTAIGTDAAGAEVNLPQTGNNSVHAAAAVGGAAALIAAGYWLMRRASRKKDEDA